MPPDLLILSGTCLSRAALSPFAEFLYFPAMYARSFPVIPSSGDNLAEIVRWRYYLSEICPKEVTKMPNIVEVVGKIFTVHCTEFVCHFVQIFISVIRFFQSDAPLLFRIQEDAINEVFVVFLVFFFIQMTNMSHVVIVVAKI